MLSITIELLRISKIVLHVRLLNFSNSFQITELIFRSVNEIICHGIPDLRPLQDGDILNSKSL